MPGMAEAKSQHPLTTSPLVNHRCLALQPQTNCLDCDPALLVYNGAGKPRSAIPLFGKSLSVGTSSTTFPCS